VRCGALTRGAIKSAFLEAIVWVETVDREISAIGA